MVRSIDRRGLGRCALVWVWVIVSASSVGGVAEEEPPMEAGAEAEAPQQGGRVARSAFTTAVVDREPTDSLDALPSGVETVSYFTELRGLEGKTVIHRWSFGGEVVMEVPFEVAAPRWRVHSTKRIDPTRSGEWTVSVVVAGGELLSEERLRPASTQGD